MPKNLMMGHPKKISSCGCSECTVGRARSFGLSKDLEDYVYEETIQRVTSEITPWARRWESAVLID